jgi:hypothetical protein
MDILLITNQPKNKNMTQLQISIEKIDALDLTSTSLRYEIKYILFDHISAELEKERELLNS